MGSHTHPPAAREGNRKSSLPEGPPPSLLSSKAPHTRLTCTQGGNGGFGDEAGTGLGLGVSSAEGCLCCSPRATESHREQVPEGERLKGIGFPLWDPELETHEATPRTSLYFPPYIPGREGCRDRARTQTVTHSESGLTSPSPSTLPALPRSQCAGCHPFLSASPSP